jgi:hypothetical protein
MDIKEEHNEFFHELDGRGYIFQNKKWDETKHGFEDDMLNMAWEMWSSAKHGAKAQAVPEGRTDFEIINQTIELVDLLALSTNVFQRDPKSKVHPFESENPRVMEWWRTACQIQELLTNTDPDNCDFEEYKAMIEAQEQKG